MDLIQLLVSQLGVKEDQAKGGAGLLFKLAQQKLGAGDFSQITKALPQVTQWISSAPKADGLAGAIGAVTSMLGGKAANLGSLASLAAGFSKLNLNKDMVGKFVPVILNHVKGLGGGNLMGVLEKVLKS